METPQVKEVEQRIEQRWRATFPTGKPTWASIDTTIFRFVLGITLLFYLFFCYCCMLICQKAGKKPGPLVWLPVLKVFPLLCAAGMSYGWFLVSIAPALAAGATVLLGNKIPVSVHVACFCIVVLLGLVMATLWCFKIAKAR